RTLSSKRSGRILRIRVPVEVPARIDERVHGVGFAARRSATFWARGIHKLRHSPKRRAALLRNRDVLRQNHRQLLVRHRDQAIALAVNHWNRRTPIALAAYAPILQAKDDLCLAKSLACRSFLELFLGLGTAEPVILSAIHQPAV